jgi:hypothetical protein
MSYADLLNDRRWQKKRLEVLDAAGWLCENCGSADNSEQLHVHHKRYVRGRKPWEYDAGDLQALCEKCHKYAGDTIKNLGEAIDELKLLCGPGEIEEVTGFIKAVVALLNGTYHIRVNTYEEACGVYKACQHGDAEFIITRLESDQFDVQRLHDFLHPKSKERKSWDK